ncbi:asparagine synthase [Candidatus Woesearchaeota archaeon]|nr:asparagine synthase [Candidatus Woesearchaeota archaeon]
MIENGIVQRGKLCSEKQWKQTIATLQRNATGLFTEKEKAKAVLKEIQVQAIARRTEHKKHFGIFFSGGLDSSFLALVCKQLKKKFTCYTVGLEGARDVEYAKRVAKQLQFPLKMKILSLKEAEKIILKTMQIVPRHDVVTVGIASVVVAALELAKKDKVKIFFSGLGAEEIFAGYERHAKAPDINAECWNGLRNMWEMDFIRDYAVGMQYGITLLTPFLDKEVINIAMQVPGEWKWNKEEKKIILREIAEESGLPKACAWRKKQAAQYGSNMDKALEKLAKQHGFAYKKDYLAAMAKTL